MLSAQITQMSASSSLCSSMLLENLRFTIKFCFTKLALVSIWAYAFFSTILLIHSFLRFFTEFCVYAMFLALFCATWLQGNIYKCSEFVEINRKFPDNYYLKTFCKKLFHCKYNAFII